MTVPSIKYICPKCGKEKLSITDSSSMIPICYCTLKIDHQGKRNHIRMKRVKEKVKKSTCKRVGDVV